MPENMTSRSAASGYAIASRFSLAAKLYSIFALFAILTAAITAFIAASGTRTWRDPSA